MPLDASAALAALNEVRQGKIISGDDAVGAGGIVPDHAEAFQRLCRREGWFVIFRGVNHDATPLIADNYPTKDMGVHGKSSDWGPQAGFICLNQFFSKVVKKGQKDVGSANSESPLSLQHGYPAVPLVVSDLSLASLAKRGKVQREGKQLTSKVPVGGPPLVHTFTLVPVSEQSIEEVAQEMAALSFQVDGKVVKNPLTTAKQLRNYLGGLTATITSLAPRSGPKDGLDHLFFVKTDAALEKGYPPWFRHAEGPYAAGRFLLVLASTGNGRYSKRAAVEGTEGWPSPGVINDSVPFCLPLTADYDIYAISPPFSQVVSSDTDLLRDRVDRLSGKISALDFMVQVSEKYQLQEDKEKYELQREALRKERAKARWGIARSFALNLRKLEDTSSWGSATVYHIHGILRLNEAAKAAGYRGGFVCHHGIEQENLFYAEVDEVYTVFTPGGAVHAVPPRKIELVLADIDALGYLFYTNPSYHYVGGEGPQEELGLSKLLKENGEVAKQKVRKKYQSGKEEVKEVDVIVYHNRRMAPKPEEGGLPRLQVLQGERPARTAFNLPALEQTRKQTRQKWEELMKTGVVDSHSY